MYILGSIVIIAMGFIILFFYFGSYMLKILSENVSKHEDMLTKWNAHPKNYELANIWKLDSSFCAKAWWLLTHEVPESRIHKQIKLVQIW